MNFVKLNLMFFVFLASIGGTANAGRTANPSLEQAPATLSCATPNGDTCLEGRPVPDQVEVSIADASVMIKTVQFSRKCDGSTSTMANYTVQNSSVASNGVTTLLLGSTGGNSAEILIPAQRRITHLQLVYLDANDDLIKRFVNLECRDLK